MAPSTTEKAPRRKVPVGLGKAAKAKRAAREEGQRLLDTERSPAVIPPPDAGLPITTIEGLMLQHPDDPDGLKESLRRIAEAAALREGCRPYGHEDGVCAAIDVSTIYLPFQPCIASKWLNVGWHLQFDVLSSFPSGEPVLWS